MKNKKFKNVHKMQKNEYREKLINYAKRIWP